MLTTDQMNTATVSNVTRNFDEFDVVVDVTGPAAVVRVQNILAESWIGAASYTVEQFLGDDSEDDHGGLMLNLENGQHLDRYALTAARDHVRRTLKG